MIDLNIILITASYCIAAIEVMVTLVVVVFCTRTCFAIMDMKL